MLTTRLGADVIVDSLKAWIAGLKPSKLTDTSYQHDSTRNFSPDLGSFCRQYFPSSAEIAGTIVTLQDFVKLLSIALGSTPTPQKC